MLSRAFVEGVLVKNDLELVEVDWDRIFADYDARVIFDILDLFKPNVASNVSGCEPFYRVCVEDFGDQITAIIAHKVRNSVVCVENLLVKKIGLWIFKGEVAADHSVEDDTA